MLSYPWLGSGLLLGLVLLVVSVWIEAPIPQPSLASPKPQPGYVDVPTVNVSAVLGEPYPESSPAPTLPLPLAESTAASPDTPGAAAQAIRRAVNHANQAATLAQRATSPQQWDRVADSWLAAIAQLLRITPQSPQRIFAQRKIREYLENLAIAQRYADTSSFPRVEPSFGSPSLDEQLVLYESYVATLGVPDVLLIGSSRSLQGVDPMVLQSTLASQDLPRSRVYNFGIYGATAQVIAAVVRDILPPDYLPDVVLFPGGSRAFNASRPDLTFDAIAASSGYQRALRGANPVMRFVIPESVAAASPQSLANANANGFVSISPRFDPGEYYQQYPRVAGVYDADYTNFSLAGVQQQALQDIARTVQAQDKRFIYVNLPLTQDYLDNTRQRVEARYRTWLQNQSNVQDFQVIDLMEPALQVNQYFADPSHLNRYGAAAIARRLGTHPDIPWAELLTTAAGRSSDT